MAKEDSEELPLESTHRRESYLTERDYRDLFHFASDAIWIHDLDGCIVAANEAFEEMLGQNVDRLIGRNVREFLSGDGLSLAAKVKKKLLSGEPSVGRYEQLLLRDDSRHAIVEITTCLLRRQGKPLAFENIARDVTEKRETEKSLKFYLHRVLQAQEDERKRISRDLHDETVQSLLLIIHRLDAIVDQSAEDLSQITKEKMGDLRKLVIGVEESLRSRLQDLRPAILDDLGLPASLEWLADRMNKEGEVDVQVSLDRKLYVLPSEISLTLFRIAQEALFNVRRHSKASEALVKLELRDLNIRLTVIDNGIGFTIPPHLSDFLGKSRLGLLSMQERSQILGGNVTVRSGLGEGTTVIADIPYEYRRTEGSAR